MAPRPHPFPKRTELLRLARLHESRASLAVAIGWKANSFRARLIREGWLEDVDEALIPSGADKQAALTAALREVADLVS